MNAFVLKIVEEIPVTGEFDSASSFIDGAIIHSVNSSHWNSSPSFYQIQLSHKPKGFFFSFEGGTILFPSNQIHLEYLTEINGAFSLNP